MHDYPEWYDEWMEEFLSSQDSDFHVSIEQWKKFVKALTQDELSIYNEDSNYQYVNFSKKINQDEWNKLLQKAEQRYKINENHYENVKHPRVWKYYEHLLNYKEATEFILQVLSNFYPAFRIHKAAPVWIVREINSKGVIPLMVTGYLFSLLFNYEHNFKGKQEQRAMLLRSISIHKLSFHEIVGEIQSYINCYLQKHDKNKLVNIYNLVQYATRRALYHLLAQEEDKSVNEIARDKNRYSYTLEGAYASIRELFSIRSNLWRKIIHLIDTIVKNKLKANNDKLLREGLKVFSNFHYIYTGHHPLPFVKIFTSYLSIIATAIKKALQVIPEPAV